jgi:ABC-type glycerol-3-phosphate transport system substrate-binding protein
MLIFFDTLNTLKEKAMTNMKERNSVSTSTIAIAVIVIIIVAGIAFYFLYSSPGTTGSISSPSSGQTGTVPQTTSAAASLTVMSISGFTDSFYKAVAQDFMAQNPGVTVNVLSAPFSGILQQEQTSLQARDSSIDIVTGTPSMIGTLAQYTLDLRRYIQTSNFNMSDIIPSMQSSNGNIALPNGTIQVKALAMMSDAMLVYYRPSVWNKYKSNLKNLTTWDNFVYDESYLYNNSGYYGAFIEAATAHELWNTYIDVFAYYYHNSNLGPVQPGYGILFTRNLRPSFNSSAGVQATLTLGRMMNAQPDLVSSYGGFNYNNFPQYYTKGFNGKNFVMAIAWLAQYSSVNKTLNGDVSFTLLPGGYTQEGGSGAAINKYSKNPDLAFKFLSFALSPSEQAKMFDVQNALPGTFSGFRYLIKEHPNLSSYFSQALKAVEAGGAEPHIISSTWALIPVLDNALASVLPPNQATGQQILSVLQNAANTWIPIIRHG